MKRLALALSVSVLATSAAHADWKQAVGPVYMKNGNVCMATLIEADKVLTAQHCLFNPDGSKQKASDLIFSTYAGEFSEVTRVEVLHSLSDPLNFHFEAAKNDWMILTLKESLKATPVKISDKNSEEVIQSVMDGSNLVSMRYKGPSIYGGYGNHQNCTMLPPTVKERDEMIFTTNCKVVPGDSGGSVILLDKDNNAEIVGINVGYSVVGPDQIHIGWVASSTSFKF